MECEKNIFLWKNYISVLRTFLLEVKIKTSNEIQGGYKYFRIFLFRQFAALHIFTSPALYQQVVLLNMIKKIGIFKISCYVNHRKIIDKVHDCSWHTTSHPLFFWLFSSTFPGFNFFCSLFWNFIRRQHK